MIFGCEYFMKQLVLGLAFSAVMGLYSGQIYGELVNTVLSTVAVKVEQVFQATH